MARVRPRLLPPLLLVVVGLAGCSPGDAGPEPDVTVSGSTTTPTTGSGPSDDRTSPPAGGATIAPPDLSDAVIDCDTLERPCDHGDDPELDRLWDACAGGNAAACDRLYYDSGFGTRYEQFGNTCGDRDVLVPCPDDLT